MRIRTRAVTVIAGAALAICGCSSGAALRGTTSTAVAAALKDHNIKYKGSITCRGNQLPIDCTGSTTDARPITATLMATSSNACELQVKISGQLMAQTSGARCR